MSLATTASNTEINRTTHRGRESRRSPARRPGPAGRLTNGERAFLRGLMERPAARYHDIVVLRNGRLAALLGHPRIAVRLALAGLTRTSYPDLEDPHREGSVDLTPEGWRALVTGRRPAGPA